MHKTSGGDRWNLNPHPPGSHPGALPVELRPLPDALRIYSVKKNSLDGVRYTPKPLPDITPRCGSPHLSAFHNVIGMTGHLTRPSGRISITAIQAFSSRPDSRSGFNEPRDALRPCDCESQGTSAWHSLEDAFRGQPAIERIHWCSREASNLQRPVFQTGALPIELPLHCGGTARGTRTPNKRFWRPPLCHLSFRRIETVGTQARHRTRDLGVNSAALCRLSYLSIAFGIGGRIRTGDRCKTSRFAGERIEPLCYSDMVWVEGFEPSASWFQARCSTQIELHPV